jgi:hypothetical protein
VAPVLKTATILRGNKGQKRMALAVAGTTDKNHKRNEAARKRIAYALRLINLEENPNALKAWRLKNNKAGAIQRAKRKVILDANPAAKFASKLKRSETAERKRKLKMMRLEVNPLEKEAERKMIEEKYSLAKMKRLAEFIVDPAKKTEWIKNEIYARSRLKRKLEARTVAEMLKSARERKSIPLIDENDKEEGKNDDEMIDDMDEGITLSDMIEEEEEQKNEINENEFEEIEELFKGIAESEMIEGERKTEWSENEEFED